jgi:hypothetical protein
MVKTSCIERKANRRAAYWAKAEYPQTEHGRKLREYYSSTTYEQRKDKSAKRDAVKQIRSEIAAANGIDTHNAYEVRKLNNMTVGMFENPETPPIVEYEDIYSAK